jgi:DNA-directed RNA polymerase subunit beta
LCVFAKVNKLGFIETPYRAVNGGKVDIKNDPVYLSAEEEDEQTIAQANAQVDDKGNFLTETVKARYEGDFPVVQPTDLSLMDVGANQIASIAASSIPFLEHDDANRALMGSNMQRQAVPLLQPNSPIVGTGIEELVAKDSRVLINAEGDGVVEYVDSNEIVLKYNWTKEDKIVSFDGEVKRYPLTKFQKNKPRFLYELEAYR